MNKQEDDIEPILIGIDTFKENRILGYYRDLIRNLNIHLGNIEHALIPTTPQAVDKYETIEIPLSYLFGYLSSNDRKKYIREKYIERNEIKIPGISNEKLIETDLLDIPALTEEEAALNAFDKLKERFDMEHIDFAFPLSLLYRKATIDCEDNLFTETELLKEEIREHCSTYVKTREQKEVYDAVKNIADTFNSLVSFGVSMRKIESFIEWAINEDSTEKKFTVNKNLFSSFLLREVKYIRSIKERPFDFNFILS